MNLIEALRTKRPLRRPISKHLGSMGDGWLGSDYVRELLLAQNCLPFGFSPQSPLIDETDLFAEDWEVEQLKVTLTLQQFYKAWARACKNHFERSHLIHPAVDDVARELGLLGDNNVDNR